MQVAVECANVLGEAALWDSRAQILYWLDLRSPKLFTFDPASGRAASLALAAEPPLGALALTDEDGVLLLAHRSGIARLEAASGRIEHLFAPENGRSAVTHNDGKVDREGRFWAGTSDEEEKEPRGALWCIPPDAEPVLADAGFAVSNGPAFSPDGRTMYFSDSAARRILAYDVSPDECRPTARRVFATMGKDEGHPDGLTVDAEGCLWVAHWDGWRVTRFSPEGERLELLPFPVPRVTSLAFGGPDLGTLFVTTASVDLSPVVREAAPSSGHLFSLRPGATGIAEAPFELRLSRPFP